MVQAFLHPGSSRPLGEDRKNEDESQRKVSHSLHAFHKRSGSFIPRARPANRRNQAALSKAEAESAPTGGFVARASLSDLYAGCGWIPGVECGTLSFPRFTLYSGPATSGSASRGEKQNLSMGWRLYSEIRGRRSNRRPLTGLRESGRRWI